MKNVKTIIAVFLIAFISMSVNAQEKKIKFNKGTLKICSNKNFQISGHDGDEVIIKSLHSKRGKYFPLYAYSTDNKGRIEAETIVQGQVIGTTKTKKSPKNGFIYYTSDYKRKDGLKKLGKKHENSELGIYFIIEEKNGELIFRDQVSEKGVVMLNTYQSYEVKIPNSIKLEWTTNACDINKDDDDDNKVKEIAVQRIIMNSKSSTLSDFSGEVEISSTVRNLKLTDVNGLVSINTVGGNVTVKFDKRRPSKLYSIYSNNGFIDIEIPEKSNLTIDAVGRSVYSDVNFKILNEKETDKSQEFKLKLNSGSVKMKLDAGYGNIYLRKK